MIAKDFIGGCTSKKGSKDFGVLFFFYDLKSLCSVDVLYLVFSTASAEDNIRNPRSESGISYIGSNAQSLVERGASAIRVWTPAVHKLVVLHDKGARRILSP